MAQHQTHFLTRNRLLAALPADIFDAVWPHLEHVLLPVKRVLIEPGTPVAHVHFVETGIVSTVASLEDGSLVEVGMVGREGLVGLPTVLGIETAPHRSFVQVAGSANRIETAAFARLLHEHSPLQDLLLHYTHAFMAQLAQSIACNSRHVIGERLARWLLIAHDRVSSNELPLTHEFLCQMLGVRREGVTAALQALVAAKIVAARRGHVTVLDRAKLEGASCGCYVTVEREFGRVVGQAAA